MPAPWRPASPLPACNAACAAANFVAAAAAPECRRAGCRLPELEHSAGATLLEPVAQRRLPDVESGRVGRLCRRCQLPTKLCSGTRLGAAALDGCPKEKGVCRPWIATGSESVSVRQSRGTQRWCYVNYCSAAGVQASKGDEKSAQDDSAGACCSKVQVRAVLMLGWLDSSVHSARSEK